ncbi:MAG: hypothetical protein JOY69_02900 [Candidatus Eremiobacteraeota bacterium]|nr:hypothetical protein [Candidatus Eremiobacteraeota bacterium]
MKPAYYARILFGLSAVLFGVIALMWHDADTWQTLRRIWSVPFGTLIGNGLMVAQIAGGVGILYPRTARSASIVLTVVYAVFSVACVPGIFAHPAVYAQYGSFFEQFCLLSGAVAMCAATDANAGRSLAFGRAARLGLGLCTISFTLAQIFYPLETAQLVPKWIPPNQMFWAVLTTVAFGLAAVAILLNFRARLAIRLMTLMLGLFGVLVWIPILIAAPTAHLAWSEFALTTLIAGASWTVGELTPPPAG